ncbi:MAG: hypothetical protein O3B47_05095, partial [bacterium]|nr:hypothetical protein [bacterium]
IAAQDTEEKEKFVKDYDYQNRSDLYYVELKPNESIDVTVKMENIGKVDWNEETFIVVDQNPAFDGVISFPTKVDATLAMMEEKEVKPGETATFKFQIKANAKGETVYMNIAPLVNGVKKISDYFVLPVAVQQPIYKYEFKEAKFPKNLMKSNEEFNAWVKLKNTGNVIWEDISLEGENISASQKESSTEPGGIATFEFTFSSPEKAGYFKESLSPVIEGANWASSTLISFETVVYKKSFDSEIVSKPLVNNWEQGKNYTVSLKFRNIGSENWKKDDFSSVFVKESDFKVAELNLSPSTVEPGEIGTITFTVIVEEEAEEKEMFMLVRPKIQNKPIFSKPVYLSYSITEKQLQTLDQKEIIRIKLGFSGNPEITANGSYELYAGDTFLSTLSAGQITEVTKENGNYRVKTPNANFLKSEPIRFHPKNNAILQISNFEHRPAWNEDLNDNEYRGILEIREDEDNLIVINEIALEDYLKGLGEVSNSEEPEKIKAIMIAARTYAKYYMDIDEKFPGKPYNLDDDPNVSQKYIGYGFEKRAAQVALGVDATKGKVITYGGEVVKTPFFNQSDGVATKSALEVWGWTHTPYLKSVSDTTCDGDGFLGHGVGLSGCGAKGMAKQGSGYEEILKHYYTGIEIADLY